MATYLYILHDINFVTTYFETDFDFDFSINDDEKIDFESMNV